MGSLRVGLGQPAVVSEFDATIGAFTNQADAGWNITLLKRDGVWTVSELEFTGCR